MIRSKLTKIQMEDAEIAALMLHEHLDGDRELDEVDIDIYSEMVKEANYDFYFFCKYTLGFSLLHKNIHRKWCDSIVEDMFTVRRIMTLKPRASYKSTIYGEGLMLWLWAIWAKDIRFFYTSSNQSLLEEISGHISNYLSKTKLYGFLYDIEREPGRKNTWDVFNIKGKGDSKGNSLMFRTAGSRAVGIHPHFIIIDDPCDKDDRESVTTREAKKSWYETLTPLLVAHKLPGSDHEFKHMLYIGTRWHMEDLAHHIIDTNKKTKVWSITSESIYDSKGNNRFKEIISDADLLEIKAGMSDMLFSCQYCNDPLPEGLAPFSFKLFGFFNINDLDLSLGTNICFLDPSQGKKESDWPAVIWINVYKGKIKIFYANRTKMHLDKLISKFIVPTNIKFNIRRMYWEKNGTTLVDKTLRDEHNKKKHPMIIKGVNHQGDKDERILSLQPYIHNQLIEFRDDHEESYPELIRQLKFYPAYGHVDFPDVIEMGCAETIGKNPINWKETYKVNIPQEKTKILRGNVLNPDQDDYQRIASRMSDREKLNADRNGIGTVEHNLLEELKPVSTELSFQFKKNYIMARYSNRPQMKLAIEKEIEKIAKVKGFT